MFDLMPFGRNESNLFRYLDNMEKNFFSDFGADFSQFRTDILDDGDHYTLQAELPGFDKKDIKIQLDDNYLTIQAEHTEEKNEEKKGSFVRRERKFGSFSRSFDVTGIQADQITASYDNGVLELKLPKSEPKRQLPSHQIEIQ